MDGLRDGESHMAIDRAILQKNVEKGKGNPVLRFYRFDRPTLTVGYGMSSAFSPTNSEAIRRPTGGGAVWHGRDLIYSLVLPLDLVKKYGRAKESYRLIHQVLCDAFAQCGVAVELFDEPKEDYFGGFCFKQPVRYDVMLEGRKIAGAGQKRLRTHLLHQGSIAWEVVSENFPSLLEEDFARIFAEKLAQLFGLSVVQNSLGLDGEWRGDCKDPAVFVAAGEI